jgi:hypothetical protein
MTLTFSCCMELHGTTDTKHAKLEAMQVQFQMKQTLSVSHGKHGRSCKNMDIPRVPEYRKTRESFCVISQQLRDF